VRRSGQGRVAVVGEWMSFMASISQMGGDGMATVSDSGEQEVRRSALQCTKDTQWHVVHRQASGNVLVKCEGGR
jgi:hypothetical protein